MQQLAWLTIILAFLWLVVRTVERVTLKEKAEYDSSDLRGMFVFGSSWIAVARGLCVVTLVLWVALRG